MLNILKDSVVCVCVLKTNEKENITKIKRNASFLFIYLYEFYTSM